MTDIIEFPEQEISVNLPDIDITIPDDWSLLLDLRNRLRDILTEKEGIEPGGGAGVGIDGADFELLIDGFRYSIKIVPRR